MDVVMPDSIGLANSRSVASIVLIALTTGLSGSAQAAKTIYKCTKDGQITLTDKPCEGSTSSGNLAAS
jgi:hypothetical protein